MLKKSKEHLRDTGWSYHQHLIHSFKQGNKLVVIAFKSYVHGIIPSVWISDGPVSIMKMYRQIKKLQHHYRLFKKEK
jgi:hypothetical protein